MIELQNIAVKHGSMTALWDISLNIQEGERVGLLGANGAGKSTTLGAIMGVYPLSAGTIRFRGDDIGRLSPAERVAAGIALVPEGRHLFPAMSVQENLEMGAYAKLARPSVKPQLKRVFGLFPILEEKRSQPAGQLSGGQQQMVAIGRALMSNPSLLLLDEPFLGVAPIVIKSVLEALRKIAADGATILLVEQNVHRAFEFVQRGYVIENGRGVMEGSGDEIQNDPEFSTKFLGLV